MHQLEAGALLVGNVQFRQYVYTGQLQAMPNKLALIVNHENITQNWYVGNDRSMLVCNCLFRLGGAGALLSNRYLSVR